MSDITLIGKPVAVPSPAATARPVLCFERTPAGESQLKQPALALSAHATRLLMLFEEPQTLDDLRQIIDENWLPEALIELERRRLLRRVDPASRHVLPTGSAATADRPPAATTHLPSGRCLARPGRPAPEAGARLARQRAQARILFLQQIGRLSTLMVERIESCQSEAELQRLAPAFAELLSIDPLPARPPLAAR